jgi:hypothetical protein
VFGGDEAEPIPLPTETTPQALNKDDFIQQGDAICEEGNTALASVTDTSQQVDIHEGVLQQLRGLGDVTEDQDLLDKFFQAYDQLVAALQRQQTAAEEGDALGGESASTSVDEGTLALEEAATAFGFEACGQGPGATSGDTTGAPPAPSSAPSYTPPSYTPPSGGGGGGGTGGTGGGVGAP